MVVIWKVVHVSIMENITAHYFPFSSPEEACDFSKTLKSWIGDTIRFMEV
tara:strand:- start:5448 stop:5597 length:150 start_codon:yes stop_codon:yes gene_type:complete